MASAIVLEFHASHLAVVVLLGLGAILVLPLARMPLLKLYCNMAQVFCQAVLLFGPFGPTFLQQKAGA